jgi:transcriptional regulator with XRE-family HTH domain
MNAYTTTSRLAGLTYAQIADRTGWSEQRVYRLMSGKTELTAEDMKLLAVILAKPVAELYEEPKTLPADEEAKAS